MKAVLCPVCGGTGQKTNLYEDVCHGCGGKGWVEVKEDSLCPALPFYRIPDPIGDDTRCPSCGGDRTLPAGTGCPKGSHSGNYCL